MWLRIDSLASRGFSASNFNWSLGGQPWRLGLGKSSAKCLRPSSSSFFSDRSFFFLFAGLLLAPGKAKVPLKVRTVLSRAIFVLWRELGCTVLPPRASKGLAWSRSLCTRTLRDDG